MCGIFITSGFGGSFHHRQVKSLKKRGPDEIGFWSDAVIRMAHTRLSIIGLDDRGIEPLENETHVLAFNVRVPLSILFTSGVLTIGIIAAPAC